MISHDDLLIIRECFDSSPECHLTNAVTFWPRAVETQSPPPMLLRRTERLLFPSVEYARYMRVLGTYTTVPKCMLCHGISKEQSCMQPHIKFVLSLYYHELVLQRVAKLQRILKPMIPTIIPSLYLPQPFFNFPHLLWAWYV